MSYRIGSGYIDSGDLLTTTQTNTEIIPVEPKSYTFDSLHCFKFEFINKDACHFIVNGKTRCYRGAGEGWYSSEIDAEIYSFIIEESGIQYQFTGAY